MNHSKETRIDFKNVLRYDIPNVGILSYNPPDLVLTTSATSEAKKGNLDVSVTPKGNEELSALSESFNSMIVSIREHVKKQNLMQTEIQNANEELKNKNR